jgi:hypothetical protein
MDKFSASGTVSNPYLQLAGSSTQDLRLEIRQGGFGLRRRVGSFVELAALDLSLSFAEAPGACTTAPACRPDSDSARWACRNPAVCHNARRVVFPPGGPMPQSGHSYDIGQLDVDIPTG